MRANVWVIFGVVIVLVLANEFSAGAQTIPTIPICKDQFRWILKAGSLKRSQAQFPLELQRKYFDSICTFLVVGEAVSLDYRNW